ncbi:MAG: MerR family transcriptional regulator [Comamonadaceae bacterium]|nr:MerR family transcriptional regulator [Comamonadaceae bacterium]
MGNSLPPIPAKRYFTIGEAAELCGVKPHVLRYWEQEFTQLRPVKRRGNRRYYQHHEVLLVRRIRDLLYDQGFTISGARHKLQEGHDAQDALVHGADEAPSSADRFSAASVTNGVANVQAPLQAQTTPANAHDSMPMHDIVKELQAIRQLLTWPL